PLFRHRLIEKVNDGGPQNLLNQVLHADDTLVSWLLGHYKPGAELETARLLPPQDSPADRMLAGERFEQLNEQAAGGGTLVLLGADTGRKEAAARLYAWKLNRPLLGVDLARRQQEYPLELVFRLALRDAVLNRAMAYINGLEMLLDEDGVLPPAILNLLAAHPGPAIVASQKPVQPREMPDEHAFRWFTFDQPPFAQRKQVWEHYLAAETALKPADVEAIAGQFRLTSGQIHDACITARNAAAQRGDAVTGADLFVAARAYSNHRLASLAGKIEPRYGWDDIILPADQIRLLHEIINTVRSRPLVLEEWGLGKKLASSAGVATLFAGPPGTGKTMAAEIIAHELGLDLYKIDLSSVVSKYIGETEKNISRIFSEAETSNAILFFDEADALFGKRSEVRDSHDRYANIEISYLLQRMEAYDGVTILATNLRANLDEAFTRRLQFIVDFPFPQEEDRLRIWKALFPGNVPVDEALDFGLLAKKYKLPGANIRNIIISAVYLAAADGKRVGMRHLLHGTHRELQKMRRLIEEEAPSPE
ncbi:MAG: ATP-binding protein, partial [Anaerolineaceae bacterium]